MTKHLEMWTVYRHPRDYPEKFAARKWLASRAPNPTATSDMFVADTLEELRALLPAGLYRLPRDPNDEPVIVETWI